MASRIAVRAGQAALISSEVKINLSSLRTSSDNCDNCHLNYFIVGLWKIGQLGDVTMVTMFGKMSADSKTIKYLYNSVYKRENPCLYKQQC